MRLSLLSIPAALAAALALSALALPPASADETVEVADTVETAATVQTVDMVTRQILLRDDRTGEVFVITAGPEVKNLDQLEPGDKVRALYTRGVAARMAPAGAEGSSSVEVVAAAEKGDKPALIYGKTTTEVVTLLAYDAAGHVATFRDSTGATRSVTVEKPEMQRFAETLKPGAKVEITWSDALAIGVFE